MKKINAHGRRVLIIPDTHAPFQHQDAWKFLNAVKQKYLDDESLVVHLGDELDGNKLSFHEDDPDIEFSPSSELKAAIKQLKRLEEIFPKMYLCESNHGSLVYRRQKCAGIPRHCLKNYNEILGTPDWHWYDDILLETTMGGVYICHGKTSSTGKLVKEMGCYGAIQGHYHGKMQIVWQATATGIRFDAFGGCLINRDSLAFAYGKNNIPKPLLGCLLISRAGYPQLIKMITNEEGRWIWELP